MTEVLRNEDELNARVFQFQTSALKQNGKKINYYDFINSMENEDCNNAIIRIISKFDIGKINSFIEDVYKRQGYTFEGLFTDPRTKQNQVTEFTFNRNDVVYAKWHKIEKETTIDEIIQKDNCYLTDEEQKIKTEYIKGQNKAYIDEFDHVAPSETKVIIVDSGGDINKQVGEMN